MPYIPHTKADTQAMLEAIGVENTEALFDEIPSHLRAKSLDVPEGMNEMNLLKLSEQQASKNQNGLCFLGAGSYEHHIPAAVWDIATRGEFLTAYTPYQAEASQGTLQLLYEFQTMIARLTGMEVANASMYDGATALAEAILMSVRIKKNVTPARILLPHALHPAYRQTVETILAQQNISLVEIPYHPKTGTIDIQALDALASEPTTALIIAQPNFFGCLEEVNDLTDWAHQHDMLVIACVNPISLGILSPPGEWGEKGADIVCAEGQPLGIPMASGGPYLGILSTKLSFVRQLPGRLVGRTVDKRGKPGFTLTLQAREQHIRREKATSNICTNQGLLATAATLYMSFMGAEGIEDVALSCHQQTETLIEAITAIPGIKRLFDAPTFHEVVISLPIDGETFLNGMQQQGILAGYALKQDFKAHPNAILLCVTEMRTQADLVRYQEALKTVLSKRSESCTLSS